MKIGAASLIRKSLLVSAIGLINSMIFAVVALYFPNRIGVVEYTDYRHFVLWYGLSGFFHFGFLDGLMFRQFKDNKEINSKDISSVIFIVTFSFVILNVFLVISKSILLYISILFSLFHQYYINFLQVRGNHRKLIYLMIFNVIIGTIVSIAAYFNVKLLYYIPISFTIFSCYSLVVSINYNGIFSRIVDNKMLKRGLQIYLFNIIFIFLFDMPRILHQFDIFKIAEFASLSLSQSIIGIFSLFALSISRILFRSDLFNLKLENVYRLLIILGLLASISIKFLAIEFYNYYRDYDLRELNWFVPMVPVLMLLKGDILNDIRRDNQSKDILVSLGAALLLVIMLLYLMPLTIKLSLLISQLGLIFFVVFYFANSKLFRDRMGRMNLSVLVVTETFLLLWCY